jgi:hypothetical protein
MRVMIAFLVLAMTCAAEAAPKDRGAADDLAAARRGAQEDAAPQARLEAANPQMYWLDYSSDRINFDTRRDILNGWIARPLFSDIAECEREAYAYNRSGRDKWKCRPTAITLKMWNAWGRACDDRDRAHYDQQACKDGTHAMRAILLQEIGGTVRREPEFWK